MSIHGKSKWFNPPRKMFRVKGYWGDIEEILIERETPQFWVVRNKSGGKSEWSPKASYPVFESREEAVECYLAYLRKERTRIDAQLQQLDERIRLLRDPDKPAPPAQQKKCLEFIYGEIPPPPVPSEFERLCQAS